MKFHNNKHLNQIAERIEDWLSSNEIEINKKKGKTEIMLINPT